MEELISIIVPVYNVEKYLEQCIETLIKQTYKNIEIILIDDASTDSSGEICDQYKKREKNLIVIHKQKNEGASKARNDGIEIAKGKYIAFVDSDDYIDITMYDKLHKKIKEDDSDIAISGYSKVMDNGRIKDFILDINNYPKNNKVLYDMIGVKPESKYDISIGMSVWKCLYKSSIIKNNNICFETNRDSISEDMIFQIEYFKYVDRVSLLKDCLYKYRFNDKSISNSYKKDRFEKQKDWYVKERKMLQERNLSNQEILDRLDRTFFMKVKASIKQEVKYNPKNKKEIKKNIEKILNDELLIKCLKEYSIKKANLKLKMYIYLLQNKLVNVLYYIYKII